MELPVSCGLEKPRFFFCFILSRISAKMRQVFARVVFKNGPKTEQKIARTAKFCAVKKQGEKGPENPSLATIFHCKFTEKQNFARMKNMARNNDHFFAQKLKILAKIPQKVSSPEKWDTVGICQNTLERNMLPAKHTMHWRRA